MNYRHLYHAGGFFDVFKHALLAQVLGYLRRKETPFCVLDTHSGIGLYDLSTPESEKTGEAAQGIYRLADRRDIPDSMADYMTVVQTVNTDSSKSRYYPGSPIVARHFLRPQDRLILAELHPNDAQTLKRYFRQDAQVAVHHMDGYQALKAYLPPKEKRGVVLIDPAFEEKDELGRVVKSLAEAYRRWPTGIFMVWYPIKERPALWTFEEAILATELRRILKIELLVHPEETHLRLNGCGMLIINPPWKFEETWKETLTYLGSVLSPGYGKTSVSWLVGE